jgi:hypothetical protein
VVVVVVVVVVVPEPVVIAPPSVWMTSAGSIPRIALHPANSSGIAAGSARTT